MELNPRHYAASPPQRHCTAGSTRDRRWPPNAITLGICEGVRASGWALAALMAAAAAAGEAGLSNHCPLAWALDFKANSRQFGERVVHTTALPPFTGVAMNLYCNTECWRWSSGEHCSLWMRNKQQRQADVAWAKIYCACLGEAHSLGRCCRGLPSYRAPCKGAC